jgi:sigma-E processing peptidase SpoIIGA
MDYLCIYICSKVLHRKIKLGRMLAAAALGGVYSVIPLFLPVSSAVSLALDCATCLCMCAIVYLEKGRSLGSLLLSAFLFVGISMMTGGCMTAIFNLLNKLNLPLDLVESDGISTYLFAALALVAGIISLKSGEIISRRAPIKECKLHLRFCGKDFELLGLSDSGNLVRDPITGKPVIFVDRETIEKQVPLDFLDRFAEGKLDRDAPCKNLRIISLRTATGTSIATAAAPESISIEYEDKNGKTTTAELSILISPAEIGKSAEGYTAIIPAEIIK